MAESYDGWSELPSLTSVTNLITGWEKLTRDKKIGAVLGVIRGGGKEESREELEKLQRYLARESEHHFRYLAEVRELYEPQLAVRRARGDDEVIQLSKGELFGEIFQREGGEEGVKIVSIPEEFKFANNFALKKFTSRISHVTTSYRNSSPHFVDNLEIESDSDSPTSGSKTPRSRTSPGPSVIRPIPQRGVPRGPPGRIPTYPHRNPPPPIVNAPRDYLGPIKTASRYVKPPPKVQLISATECQEILNQQTTSALEAKQRLKDEKEQRRLKEIELLKLSKIADRNARKSAAATGSSRSRRIDPVPDRSDGPDSRKFPRLNSNPTSPPMPGPKPKLKFKSTEKIRKFYGSSDLPMESASEHEEVFPISSSDPEEKPDQNSSDIEFDKIINDHDKDKDNSDAAPHPKKTTSASRPSPTQNFSGYPENGEEKARTTLQLLHASLIVNPLDLSLIMNCLKGTYYRPSHLTQDYYRIVISEPTTSEGDIPGTVVAFEIHFDPTLPHHGRWELVTYTVPH